MKDDKLREVGETVRLATKGFDKSDRKFAYHYLRNHVLLDELHAEAVKAFKGKIIQFGSGSLAPKIVVVTRDPIPLNAKHKLEKAFQKLDIPTDEIYYAHLRFVSTKRKQDIRQDLLNKLVNTLRPHYVLSLDSVNIDTDIPGYFTADHVSIFTDPEAKEERKALMRALRDRD